MSTPIYWSILLTVWLKFFVLNKVTIPSQHIHDASTGLFSTTSSIDYFCLDRILFTFLMAETSDSSFWIFSFIRWTSTVSETIVALVCSWVLRNKSIIWFLFNAQLDYYNGKKYQLNKHLPFSEIRIEITPRPQSINTVRSVSKMYILIC